MSMRDWRFCLIAVLLVTAGCSEEGEERGEMLCSLDGRAYVAVHHINSLFNLRRLDSADGVCVRDK